MIAQRGAEGYLMHGQKKRFRKSLRLSSCLLCTACICCRSFSPTATAPSAHSVRARVRVGEGLDTLGSAYDGLPKPSLDRFSPLSNQSHKVRSALLSPCLAHFAGYLGGPTCRRITSAAACGMEVRLHSSTWERIRLCLTVSMEGHIQSGLVFKGEAPGLTASKIDCEYLQSLSPCPPRHSAVALNKLRVRQNLLANIGQVLMSGSMSERCQSRWLSDWLDRES